MDTSVAMTSWHAASDTDKQGAFLCTAGGFFLSFQSCLTFLFFQSDPQFGTAVRLGVTLTWLLTVVGYTIVNPPPQTSGSEQRKPLMWIAIYLGLAAVSMLWTKGDSLSVAGSYWAGVAANVASVYLLLRYPQVDQNTRRIMYGFVAGALVVAVIAWSAPTMEDLRLGNEDFLHPNLIGFQFAIATLFSIYMAQLKKWWIWVAVALGVTMIRTLSKGTIVAFLFAGLYYLLRGLRISHKARLWIAIASSLILIGFWGLMETYLDIYTQSTNLETLTGRTYIWAQALDFSLEHPWIGHGFDSFRWIFPPFNNFQANHAHNELLQTFFSYGIVGLVVVVALYWSFYRQVRSSQEGGLRSLAMAMLILVLVRGVVDTDQFDLGFPLWLMTVFSVALSHTSMSKAPSLA
jgi:exopolysaccharide production protein ExoQ